MSSVANVNDFSSIMDSYDPSLNTTRNVMTKFEKAKVIGLRLEQLARGMMPCVDIEGLKTIREICLKELETRNLPFIIVRPLPNGKKEYWRLSDMIIP